MFLAECESVNNLTADEDEEAEPDPIQPGPGSRLICEVAVATQTHPGPWFHEDERTVMTVVAILEEQANEIRRKGK